MLSQFTPGCEPKSRVQHYLVPDEVRTGDSSGVFNFMAESIHDFVNKYEDLRDEELPLGFCFSFPMAQDSLNSARLLNWTINFGVYKKLKFEFDFVRICSNLFSDLKPED